MNFMAMGLEAQEAQVYANKLAKLRGMIQAHNLGYSNESDIAKALDGKQSYQEIMDYASMFGIDRKDLVSIWNFVVDSKLKDGAREQFYLKL